MEILVLILAIVAWVYGLRLLKSLGSAGWRAATGKGSFKSNFEASFVGMSAMEMRLRPERIANDKFSYDVYRVEVKGLMPVQRSADLSIATAVFDITEQGPDGKPIYSPVTCFLDNFQEPDSICYQDVTKIGTVRPETGFVDWVTVANLIPDTLTAPYSGRRKLAVYITLFDSDSPPTIRRGFVDGARLASFGQTFQYVLKNTGYKEESENRRRAEELTIHAALSMAMSDGAIADAEGNVIKRWMARSLDMVEPSERAAAKTKLNAAMIDGFNLAKAGKLDLGAVLAELARVGEPPAKSEAIELCLEVMSADGVADAKELQHINRMAEKLGIDLGRFKDMKDKHIVRLSTTVSEAGDYHALLGIEQSWSKDEMRSHLNRLYSQWNSRAESLEDPEKREQAERMLETIAAARKALLG